VNAASTLLCACALFRNSFKIEIFNVKECPTAVQTADIVTKAMPADIVTKAMPADIVTKAMQNIKE
jgi:hypothetical protein